MSRTISARYRKRLFVNRFNLVMSLGTMAFGMAFLLWILFVLFQQGLGALSPTLFTQMTPPPGSSGGLLNAIAGSIANVAPSHTTECAIVARSTAAASPEAQRNPAVATDTGPETTSAMQAIGTTRPAS